MNSSADDKASKPRQVETELVTAGRDTKAQKGFVNPPVVHGSTVLYPTVDDLHAHRGEFQYARHGTPTTKAFQQALMALEAPGSQSFEMPDIRAIASAVHAHGAIVIDDNTWATPLFHRSLEQGVDISMQAATKYIGGHSDIMFGTISANAKAWPRIAEGIRMLGVCAGPDDVFLAIRGLRTLAVRLAQHHRSGLEMARWLAARPEVIAVLHPALENHPGHAIWKRDFTGASGLFSIVLKPAP